MEAGKVFETIVQMNSRNPLSLDMGWKFTAEYRVGFPSEVAIRFRWIWVGSKLQLSATRHYAFMSQSAFAGYGLEVNRSKKGEEMIVGRNPLSLDMGWKLVYYDNYVKLLNSRNPLSLDMGWKPPALIVPGLVLSCRNPLSLDMGWKQ